MSGQTTDIILLAQATTPAPSGADSTAQAAAAVGAAANQAAATATQGATGSTEAAPSFPPFDASTFGAQVFWLLICFAVLYIVVARAVLPRVGGILKMRREKIDGDLAEADRLRKETDKAIAAHEAALAAARTRAHGIAQETRDKTQAELNTKRAAVESELNERVQAAEISIQAAKSDALTKVDEIAADTAQALVTQLTGDVSPEAARAAVLQVVKGDAA